MFLTAVSMGVAAVPEGLPAIVTIALTLGSQRMLRRKALIRKLAAVETLGTVNVICSDKTGTITEARWQWKSLSPPTRNWTFGATRLRKDPAALRTSNEMNSVFWLAGGALCNDATLQPVSSGLPSLLPLGDSTEVALLLAASRFGLKKSELEAVLPRIREVPFSPERKRMTTVHMIQDQSSKFFQELKCAQRIERALCCIHEGKRRKSAQSL